MVPQNPATHARKLKLRWFVTLSTLPLLGVVTAFGIMPQSAFNLSAGKQIVEELSLPTLPATADSNAAFWRNDRVQRGDTVAELLQRLNVDDSAASNYLRTNKAAESLRRLSIGKDVQAETAVDGSLLALRYLNNNGNEIIIEKSGSTFRTSTLPLQTERRLFIRTGEITTTLYAATDSAGLPDPVANQMAEIFGGDIDFHRDLHKGDKFSAIYEMTYSNGRPVRSGNILAAEFVNNGRTYRALYYQTSSNRGDYFSQDGKSMHKAFLRSPIEYSRISSGFSSSRLHPILNKMRAHKGVDYAAPLGTKVKATADGVVTFVGKQGGYGNLITLSHQGVYTTVYGHLSRFAPGLHRGQRVTQGEIIGNVGMTGLATGPHLHYEFKINGAQRDPLRVALPDAKPISEQQKAAFQEATLEMNNRLNMLRDANLAKLD
ncbi:MAG TPA: peptidoglycan DD-metalloendopeptidase family protein [Gallionellaceae bacterium]|nr:peptidoglycan DD-metalloendopeptidase family protein [Gallionellaceae bacterium]